MGCSSICEIKLGIDDEIIDRVLEERLGLYDNIELSGLALRRKLIKMNIDCVTNILDEFREIDKGSKI